MPKEYVDDVLTGLGEAQPPEAAHGLTDDSYVLIPPERYKDGFCSRDRANCTVIDMRGADKELGAHVLPEDGFRAALLVHAVFGRSSERKFCVVVSGNGRERLDADGELTDNDGMITLLDTITDDAGGREPDVVVFPINITEVPPEYQGDPAEYGQLVHTVRLENGQEIHTFVVPGTDYFREGTMRELTDSASVCVRADSQ